MENKNSKEHIGGIRSYDPECLSSIFRSEKIKIIPNQLYRVVISFESCSGKIKITPTITLPSKKGWMKSNGQMHKYMLSTCNNPEHPKSEIDIVSEIGSFDISYHIETVDYRGTPYWGSSKVLRYTGMKKEELSESKVRYFCTNGSEDSFNSFIFLVEWFPIHENGQ